MGEQPQNSKPKIFGVSVPGLPGRQTAKQFREIMRNIHHASYNAVMQKAEVGGSVEPMYKAIAFQMRERFIAEIKAFDAWVEQQFKK